MDQNALALLMSASAFGKGAAFSAFGEERVVTPASATTTLTSMKLSDAHATRQIVVTVISYRYHGFGDMAATAITVAGVSASKLVSRAHDYNFDTSIWIATVPSGLTGDIVITTGSVTAEAISVGTFALYGASGSTATVSNQNATAQSGSLGNLAVRNGGSAIGVAALASTAEAGVPAVDVAASVLVATYPTRHSHGVGYALSNSPLAANLPPWYCAAVASFKPNSAKVDGIVYCGSAVAAATSISAVPAHKAGDLLVAFAYNASSTTVPTLPGGWTSIQAPAGVGASAMRVAYKLATSNSEAVTGFTNATMLAVHVYHGASAAFPIGGSANQNGTSNTVTYPALTMAVNDGTSRVVGFAGRKVAGGTLEAAPTGMTLRSNLDSGNEIAGFDTGAGVSSWSAQTAAAGGASQQWFTCTLEIRKA